MLATMLFVAISLLETASLTHCSKQALSQRYELGTAWHTQVYALY